MRAVAPVLCLQILSTAFVSAQALARTDAEALLATAWKDPRVELQAKNRENYSNPGIANPIEGMQFKITQGDDVADRKAGLRVRPRGFSEYQLMRQLRGQQGRIEDMTVKQQLSKALMDRYTAIFEYAVAQEKQEALTSLIALQRRELSMVRTAAARSSDTDAIDVVKSRRDLESLQIKLGMVEGQMRVALAKMKRFDSRIKESRLGIRDLPTPPELANMVERLNAGRGGQQASEAIDVRLARENAQKARDELSLDIAKGDRLLDYVEFNVSQDGRNQIFSFEVALNVPGFASSDYKIREKTRELVGLEIEARELEQEQSVILVAAKQAVLSTAELYRAIATSGDKVGEARVKKLARKQDPLLAIALDKDASSRTLSKAETYEEAYKAYLEYLTAANLFGEKPRTNFLSRELKDIPL